MVISVNYKHFFREVVIKEDEIEKVYEFSLSSEISDDEISKEARMLFEIGQ